MPANHEHTRGPPMIDKPVVEHIVRRSTLPWRPPNDRLTECGKSSADYPSMTHQEFLTKLRLHGQQRASMTSCMTCWNVTTRYRDWNVDPIDAIRREILGTRRDEDTFRKELWAIAALIDAHRDEFDGYLTGLAQTADLAARRRAKRASY